MRTEKGLFLAFLIGLILKFLHLPGAGVLLVLSLSALVLLYCPGAIYFFSDNTYKKQNNPLSIISGFFLAIITIGILFKLQYWTGANVYLLIGTVTAPIILGVTLLLKLKATDDLKIYYRNMTIRLVTLTILTTLLYITPTATLIKIQYRDDPELARLKTLYYTNPENKEYKRLHDEYMKKQDSLYKNEILKKEK
jgi:hypothetical protein